MNGWLTSVSFHVNQLSHSWDKAISAFDLETPRSRSWVWSETRSYSPPSILSICFLFISHQSHQQFQRYSYFKIWPWNIHGQGHECGQRQGHTVHPQYPINLLPFHFTSITPTILDTAISKFPLETSKVKVMSEVKVQGHILYPVSNQCTSFLFHINRTNYSWDMAKIVFDLEKNTSKIFKENLPK